MYFESDCCIESHADDGKRQFQFKLVFVPFFFNQLSVSFNALVCSVYHFAVHSCFHASEKQICSNELDI